MKLRRFLKRLIAPVFLPTAVPAAGTTALHSERGLIWCSKVAIEMFKIKKGWGTWVAQSVERSTSAQVMISQFMGSSPMSSSVLTAQSLESASGKSVSLSLSAPPPLVRVCVCVCVCVCGCVRARARTLSLSLSQK